MKETICVLIPTLNEADNITDCLRCFLNQKLKPNEIIVVDNGSKDKTRLVVTSLISKFKKSGIDLKLFFHPYGNQINARAYGINKTNCDIIASIDAETNVPKDWIYNIQKHFEEESLVGIGGKAKYRNREFLLNLIYSSLPRIRTMINKYYITAGNCAYRRKAFIQVRGFEGLEKIRKKEKLVFAKDDFFISKKLERIGKIKYYPDIKVTILYRPKNKIGQNVEKTTPMRIINRILLEMKEDRKISKYFK